MYNKEHVTQKIMLEKIIQNQKTEKSTKKSKKEEIYYDNYKRITQNRK